jgi:RNA polymerase sigma-70 factor (ECF subfamily)
MSWSTTGSKNAVQSISPGLPASDETLASRAALDPQVFGDLYQRHIERVYHYHLARTGDDADAQDLTAQTFLAALEGIHTYRGAGNFGAWLFGIARNKVALHYRSQRLETPLDTAEEAPDPSPSPETAATQRLQMAAVSRALGLLAPDRAEAIELCVFAGLTAAQAAQVMGKSDAAVKMLVMRGLRDLRARLDDAMEAV